MNWNGSFYDSNFLPLLSLLSLTLYFGKFSFHKISLNFFSSFFFREVLPSINPLFHSFYFFPLFFLPHLPDNKKQLTRSNRSITFSPERKSKGKRERKKEFNTLDDHQNVKKRRFTLLLIESRLIWSTETEEKEKERETRRKKRGRKIWKKWKWKENEIKKLHIVSFWWQHIQNHFLIFPSPLFLSSSLSE